MPITRTPMIDDDGSGTTGTILNNAWKSELYNQIDALAGGTWTTIPFSLANFSASGGTWAPTSGTIQWCQLGRAVLVTWVIGGNQTISASTVSLFIALPGVPDYTNTVDATFHYYLNGGITGTGVAAVQGSLPPKVQLLRDAGGTPFPAQSGTPAYIYGQLFYPF